MARVFSGKSGNALYTVYGDDPADEFGFAVAGELDWDGDAYADFAVGAPNGATVAGSAIAPGHIRVFAGASGTSLQKATSIFSYARWGESLCRGDLDGDGIHDLVVGAPLGGVNDNGQAKVISGATHFALEEWFGDSFGDRFGAAVSSGQDLDGDGFDEVLVGAPEDDDGGGNAGSLRLFDGQSGAALHTWYGADDQEGLGTSVAFSDDLDGDGDADVIAGAIEAWVGGTGSVLAFGSSSHAELLRLQGDPAAASGRRWRAPAISTATASPTSRPVATWPSIPRIRWPRRRPGARAFARGTGLRQLLQARHLGQRLPGPDLRQGHAERHGAERLLPPGRRRRRQERRDVLLRLERPSGEPLGQRHEPPVRRPPHQARRPAPGRRRERLLRGALFSMDLNARWCPTCPKAHHNPGAGALVQAQLWYRDPDSTSNQTTSLSNALEFGVAPR